VGVALVTLGLASGPGRPGGYAALMAARHHVLSSSIASLHGDEQTVGTPLDATELTALQRTRLFGATGTVLMAIGALGAGARPVVQDPTFGVRLLNLPSRIQTVSLTMTTTGAVMMALAWLMLGRFALGSRRMSRGDLDRTLLLWTLPLLIAPPMYSKDVYSYLAQSQISLEGLDPYRVGPASGLGLSHVFTLSVPTLWRDTPAPYGPLFLWVGRGISAVTGENIVAAVLCHRLVELIGVGLIVWATPRLARRCGVAEVSALWLGAANPLLIMHLVAGVHNEALMLGLMLAGSEFALRGIDSPRLMPDSWRPGPHWEPLGMLLAGAILIILSSQVKLPSLLALGFVTMALAYRCGGNLRALLLAGGAMTALSLAVMAVVGWASGLGFGWIFTLGTANVVRSWMSPPTLLALGTGQVGILLGLGDHTTSILGLTRGIGVLIITVMVAWLLLAVFRGRLHPIGGLGVALGVTVLLFPVVQPWYLLWAIIPLAAWATRTGFRLAAIVISLIVGIFGPTANGDRFALFQIVDATLASTAIVVALIALTYTRLPWRRLPVEAAETRPAAVETAPAPEAAATPRATPSSEAAPDAYADST
jgi:alpha-1,6-mannosyltransferase